MNQNETPINKAVAIQALKAIEEKDEQTLNDLGIRVYGNKGRLWSNTACITSLDDVKKACNPRLSFNYCTPKNIGCPECLATLKQIAAGNPPAIRQNHER